MSPCSPGPFPSLFCKSVPYITKVFLHRFRRGGVEPGGQPEEGAGGEAGGQVPEEADVLQGRVLCIRKDLFRVYKD